MKITVVFDIINKAKSQFKAIRSDTSKTIGYFNRLQGCLWKFNQTSELFERLGGTVERISAPFKEYEQAMAELSSITGITGDDLTRLGKVARQTGISSGLGAKGAADAFALLASQIQVSDIGMDGLIELQKQTISLAQAGGLSMNDAAIAMAGTINQFGLQATEANRVINVLAAGSKYGAANISEISQSFKVVGAAANAAGLSVEGTAGAIEALSKNNLKGAEAGTALRNILLKMQTSLGVDFNKTSLAEALTELKPKYKDAAYMAQLFGMENMAAAQFLVANSDLVAQLTDQVTDTNVATEQAAINTDTWSHRMKVHAARINEWSMKLTESNKGIMYGIQVGSQLVGMATSLTPVVGIFWGVLKGIGRFASFANTGIKNLGIATKLSAFWTSVCSKAQLVGSAVTSLWSKRTAFAAMIQGGLVKALRVAKTTMLTGVIPALTGVIASTWAWTAALLANPITWIVLTIGALIAALVICWQRFAEFRAVILTIWDSIKGFGQAILEWVVAPFKMAWEIVGGIGKAIGALFSGDFSGAWDSLKEGFGGAVDEFKKPIKTAFETAGAIGGNYNRHLEEERAKQEEKEKEKKEKQKQKQEEQTGNNAARFPDFNIPDPDFDFPDPDFPDFPTEPRIIGFDGMGEIGNMPAANAFPSNISAPRNYMQNTAPNVSVNYNPNINVSSDMTQKSKDDLMKMMKENAAEFARIIRDELRRSERGSYGLS